MFSSSTSPRPSLNVTSLGSTNTDEVFSSPFTSRSSSYFVTSTFNPDFHSSSSSSGSCPPYYCPSCSSDADCRSNQKLVLCSSTDICFTNITRNERGVIVDQRKGCMPSSQCPSSADSCSNSSCVTCSLGSCTPGCPPYYCPSCSSDSECRTNQQLVLCSSSDICFTNITRNERGVIVHQNKGCLPSSQCPSLSSSCSNSNCVTCSLGSCSPGCPPYYCPSCSTPSECQTNPSITLCNQDTELCFTNTTRNDRGIIINQNKGCISSAQCPISSASCKNGNCLTCQNGSCTGGGVSFTTSTTTPTRVTYPGTVPARPCCFKSVCPICKNAYGECSSSEISYTSCEIGLDYCKRQYTISLAGSIIRDERSCSSYPSCPFGEDRFISSTNTIVSSCSSPKSCEYNPINCKDPCSSSPCKNGAVCNSISESNYKCKCDDGWKGKNCQELDRLLPYGIIYGDKKLSLNNGDDGYFQIRFPLPFKFGCQAYDSYFVNVNGYITLGSTMVNHNPSSFPIKGNHPNMAIIAPFWTDLDLGHGNGTIYYNCHSRLNENFEDVYVSMESLFVFNVTDEFITQYKGDNGFSSTMVCIITYYKVSPFPSFYKRDEQATFQVVLASDIKTDRSYIIFNFNNINWKISPNRKISQGYQYGQRNLPNSYHELFTSMKMSAHYTHIIQGPAGPQGQWLFHTSIDNDQQCPSDRDEYKCKMWSSQQYKEHKTFFGNYKNVVPSCPCFLWQADYVMFNPVFRKTKNTFCFSMSPQKFVYYPYIVEKSCCYSERSGQLITEPSWDSGSISLSHAYYSQRDDEAKEWCCGKTKGGNLKSRYLETCKLFFKARPVDKCENYQLPRNAFSFGEPHIVTPDNATYVFNGLGEYWLIKDPNKLLLQGRTSKAWDIKGNEVNFTIFTAFAAIGVKEGINSSRLFVGLNKDRNDLVIVIDDNVEKFEEGSFNGFQILKNGSSLIVIYDSGFGFKISLGFQQLSCSLILPINMLGKYDFKGLFGNYDGVPNNDLKCNPESPRCIAEKCSSIDALNSLEKDIFECAQTWLVERIENTLFYYEDPKNSAALRSPDFVPEFSLSASDADIALIKSTICNGTGLFGYSIDACVYDYLRTGNKELAVDTLITSQDYFTVQKLRDTSNIIRINGPANDPINRMKWTVGVESSIELNVISLQPISNPEILMNFTLENGTNYSFHQSPTDPFKWYFTWTPKSLQPVTLSFIGSDSVNTVPLNIYILLCDCNQNGTCEWTLTDKTVNQTNYFQVASCFCDQPYIGDRCDSLLDQCFGKPCGNSTCTNLSPEEVDKESKKYNITNHPGYVCHGCDPGFTYIDFKCQDINECANASLNNCSAGETCVNTQGSYSCECYGGNTSSCPKCYPGYWGENCTKVCQCLEAHCDSNSGCNTCPNPGLTGSNCSVDIDECLNSTTNLCSANSNCSDSYGAYECICNKGYVKELDVCLMRDYCLYDSDGSDLISKNISRCSYNGICVNGSVTLNHHDCMCNEGYEGTVCQTKIDYCASKPCQNNATCLSKFNSFQCQCLKDYGGTYCQYYTASSTATPAPQTDPSMDWLIILLGTLLGIAVLIIAILLSVFITMKVFGRRTRNEPETSQEQDASAPQQPKAEAIQSTILPTMPSQSTGLRGNAQLPQPQSRIWRAGSRWLPAYVPRHPDMRSPASTSGIPVLLSWNALKYTPYNPWKVQPRSNFQLPPNRRGANFITKL